MLGTLQSATRNDEMRRQAVGEISQEDSFARLVGHVRTLLHFLAMRLADEPFDVLAQQSPHLVAKLGEVRVHTGVRHGDARGSAFSAIGVNLAG
jgi:hypothetical protein